jgi:isopropylmalate/homocitrate/citramalate synthase
MKYLKFVKNSVNLNLNVGRGKVHEHHLEKYVKYVKYVTSLMKTNYQSYESVSSFSRSKITFRLQTIKRISRECLRGG